MRANADEHPDLFWALRGGSGNFGVATGFLFRLHPAGLALGGAHVYPAERAVLRGSESRVGKPVVVINLCYTGDIATGDRVVQPLRKVGKPIADVVGRMPYPSMFGLTEEATKPQPFKVRTGYLNELPDGVLDAVLSKVQEVPLGGGLVQFRALGGAMARVPADATAFSHRDKRFMAIVEGMRKDGTWTLDVWDGLRPVAAAAYVMSIKREYRSTNLFMMNRNIR